MYKYAYDIIYSSVMYSFVFICCMLEEASYRCSYQIEGHNILTSHIWLVHCLMFTLFHPWIPTAARSKRDDSPGSIRMY